MTTNKNISREIANNLLASVIERALKWGGYLELLCVRLNSRLEREAENDSLRLPYRNVGKAQLQSWLHPDPRKRIEPQFGMGTLLLSVAEELNQELKMKKGKK